ncbi:MAG: 3-deoxy-D-manno-octulosonic acid transferase [Terriglobia bacterium]
MKNLMGSGFWPPALPFLFSSMYLLYSFCFTVGLILAAPYFLYQGFFHKKYFAGLGQRLGFLPTAIALEHRNGIWVHAVSVGEFLAVLPLLHALKKEFPENPLVVTTTTMTGQQLARQKLEGMAQVLMFPLDWSFVVRRFLRVLQPAIVLIVETELWPNFLRECHQEKVPLLLVNGRISDTSMVRYRKITWFMRSILKHFSYFLMQSHQDRDRLIGLGAPAEKIAVSGNLKYDLQPPQEIERLSGTYRRQFGFTPDRFVVIAGSTMKGEEEMVVAAFQKLAERVPHARLILAPRHPQRVQEVEGILATFGLPFKKRSELTGEAQPPPDCRVILLDTMGELFPLYHLADAVFVGGSLVPRGGHNIMEPALYQKPILVGPHMDNFREIARQFLERQAALSVPDGPALADRLIELARKPEWRTELGARAGAILNQNRGATQRTLNQVRNCLAGT